MTILEILLIGIALSMDAFSVSLSSGMVYPNMTKVKKWSMPVAFGLFQGLMPMAGYFLGYAFESIISKWQGPIALIILGLIGLNMIKEGLQKDKDEDKSPKVLTIKALIFLAVATSIDAFAVGVSFAASGVTASFAGGMFNNIFTVGFMIAVITFVMCIFALIVGKKVGERLGDRAEILGGIILILIGIKAMFF